MGKRIHAGSGGQRGGQANDQLGIRDDNLGQHRAVKDDLLFTCRRIGQHRRAPDLAAGSGGGRHRNDRGDGLRIGAISLPTSRPDPPPKATTPS